MNLQYGKAHKVNGQWNQSELQVHINALELLAVLKGLKELYSEINNQHIRVMCDNATALLPILTNLDVSNQKNVNMFPT